jgi:tight adherence protein C
MLNEIMDYLLDPKVIISAVTALAAFATVITLTTPLVERDKLGARLKGVATRREELRAKQRETLANKGKGQLRTSPKTFMKNTVDRFNLRKMLDSSDLRLKLAQAGLRGQGPMVTFAFFRLIAPPVGFFFALFYLFAARDFGLSPTVRFAAVVAVACVAYFAPDVFISNLISKRKASIQQCFPDALDLLLICVESGMSIEAALNKVASEIGTQSVELAEELALTTAELSYLAERRTALENFGKRTDLEGVKAVTTALIQAERYGTPMGQALRVMAQENRDIRMGAAEKKAAALPAQLTVPMIVFFLPALFVVILGPAIIQVMKAFHG